MESESVVLLMPCAGDLDPYVMVSACAMVSTAERQGVEVKKTVVVERMLIHNARENLAKYFLNQTDAKWAFWMDSDMILEPKTIVHMVKTLNAVEGLFATGVYYRRTEGYAPLIMARGKNIEYEDEYCLSHIVPPEGNKSPFVVDACGFGCALTHRDVFKDLEKPYFKFTETSKGREVSEDFYFCKKVKEKGIKLWVVPDLKCIHLGLRAPVDSTYFKVKDIMKIELEGKNKEEK